MNEEQIKRLKEIDLETKWNAIRDLKDRLAFNSKFFYVDKKYRK